MQKLREFNNSKDYEITCQIQQSKKTLSISYEINGPIENLFPNLLENPIQKPGTDLWKNNCLEAFFFDTRSPAYAELNFTPYGDCAFLYFSSYRKPGESNIKLSVSEIKNTLHSKHKLKTQIDLVVELKSNETHSLFVSPTVILYPSAQSPLYFALGHDVQPNFHNREVVEKLGFNFLSTAHYTP